MKRIYDLISTNIKRRRKAMGITQDELAELSGLNKMTINRIEGGQPARASNLTDIAKALKCKELDLVVDPDTETSNGSDFSKAIAVLSRLEHMDPDLRKIVLALVFEDPSLAAGIELDLAAIFSDLLKRAK